MNLTLDQYLGVSRQLAPDIIDFRTNTIYEIKSSKFVIQGIAQLESYYKLAELLKIKLGGENWDQLLADWTPLLLLYFPRSLSKLICVYRGPVNGLILYKVFEKKKKKNTDGKNKRKGKASKPKPPLKQAPPAAKVAPAAPKPLPKLPAAAKIDIPQMKTTPKHAPKPRPGLGSVAKWGKVSPFDAAMLYLDLHAPHFAALADVKQRAAIANDLLSRVEGLERGARTQKGDQRAASRRAGAAQLSSADR